MEPRHFQTEKTAGRTNDRLRAIHPLAPSPGILPLARSVHTASQLVSHVFAYLVICRANLSVVAMQGDLLTVTGVPRHPQVYSGPQRSTPLRNEVLAQLWTAQYL